ncbi:hypothetical protein CRUP_027755, partial [Coryphaenoides rupestris]
MLCSSSVAALNAVKWNSRLYGLFGRCRSSKQDQVQYQVSVAVLKRMQEVLKQLMLHAFHVAVLTRSKPQSQKHSSKSVPMAPVENYLDYMIVEAPRSPLHMQTASMDPYTDEVERSLHPVGGGLVYGRPSARSQANQRERERDRQLLQEAMSHYLASAQPSYRHRGAAPMTPAGLPYYEDLELELPVDYVDDYTMEERVDTAGSRQQAQPKKKPLQDISRASAANGGLLQRMSGVLEGLGVDPRSLSPQQLSRLALFLQLIKAEDKTEPLEKDLLVLKETQLLQKADSKAPGSGPETAPPQPAAPLAAGPGAASSTPSTSSSSAPAPPTAAVAASPVAKGPAAAPAQAGAGAADGGQALRDPGVPLDEGPGAKEEYGYIVTNQSPLSLYDGIKLLELLADKINLATSSFINISVVGPALTFRIRQNEHNMTAAEVA